MYVVYQGTFHTKDGREYLCGTRNLAYISYALNHFTLQFVSTLYSCEIVITSISSMKMKKIYGDHMHVSLVGG